MGYPLEHPHKLCCLRQELVDAFVESRYMTFIKVAAYHLQKYGFKNQAAQENAVTAAETSDAANPVKEESSEIKQEPVDDAREKVTVVADQVTTDAIEEQITKPVVKTEGNNTVYIAFWSGSNKD